MVTSSQLVEDRMEGIEVPQHRADTEPEAA